MQSGSPAQTLGVLQQVLRDIGKAVTENGRNGTSSSVPTSIKNSLTGILLKRISMNYCRHIKLIAYQG